MSRMTIVLNCRRRIAPVMMTFALFFAFPSYSNAADSAVQVELDSKKAAPRAVESLTERQILHDYGAAWTYMAHVHGPRA
jgi:hypothetical protein